LIDQTASISSQRAASEIVAGMMRASKNWNIVSKNDSLRKVDTLLKTALIKCNSESLGFWAETIRYIGVVSI
jgi:hypothetical protein